MPNFKLDGREIPFEPGETIISAARRAGVDIPHYCWHPGLSVAANCRMCLVELLPPPGRKAMLLDVLEWDAEKQDYVPAKKPKLVPSCQQAAGEGMEVLSSQSEHVSRARSSVQELLLLNHPVDCPICDQAGECRLQDYWLEHQGTKKRMHDEIVHKPKGVVFGPTIVYDAERCIVCTRCVRFCEEVAKDPVLEKRERGNVSEIVLAPGRELDNAYTLMTEYVCPVGALTARDFRFKARVWFLRSVESVCTGCATGCNSFTDFDPRDHTVYRYRPRENMAVNQHWMCDEGMLDYRRINENRVLKARVRGKKTTLADAIEKASGILSGVEPDRLGVVLSAQHSNEDNFALLRLARDYLGTGHIYVSGRAAGLGDAVLKHADRNPNTAGVTELCTSSPPMSFTELAKDIHAGQITHVLALGSYSSDAEKTDALGKLQGLVTFATHEGPLAKHATAVLPASSWAESDGTFVNAKGVAQESEKAIDPKGDSLPAWKLTALVAQALELPMAWTRLSQVRKAMAPEAGAAVAVATGAEA
ncbi:MAG: (2Fe-2S)-binding protein [Myxococcales bacterium]|nr:(2Fe-2S)-binding protein [Myxococcales bacterium]